MSAKTSAAALAASPACVVRSVRKVGLDGITYTIDLSEKKVAKLRKALDPYLAVATRAG